MCKTLRILKNRINGAKDKYMYYSTSSTKGYEWIKHNHREEREQSDFKCECQVGFYVSSYVS